MRIQLRDIRMSAIGLILLLVGGGIGYFLGTRDVALSQESGGVPVKIVNQLKGKPEDVDFGMFWEVWDQLSRTYLDPKMIDSKKMVYGAIEGMTASLGDPYTVFLPPTDNQKSKEDLNGEFGGVGVQLGFIEKTLAVMSPLDDTPASKQGILAGDLILHLKDESKQIDRDTDGISLQEAVETIRGPVGTSITLSLYREGTGAFEATLIRETITVPSVELKIGDWVGNAFVESDTGKIAWLKVSRFGENTDPQWNEAVSQILAKRPQLSGAIVDLRNNPGGYVQSAIHIASEFIPDGVIIQQKGRYMTETYSVNRQGKLVGFPIVVLINKGSASASEIVSGALRDRLQAKLVGSTSFGKGTVQDTMDLRGNAGLHITIARWLLPGGDWIHDTGLKPDIEVELPELAPGQSATSGAALEDTQLKRAIEEL